MSKLDFKRSSMRHIENYTCFALLRHTNCQTLAKLCFSPTSIRRLALLSGLKHHTIRKSRSREKPSHALLCCTELTLCVFSTTAFLDQLLGLLQLIYNSPRNWETCLCFGKNHTSACFVLLHRRVFLFISATAFLDQLLGLLQVICNSPSNGETRLF